MTDFATPGQPFKPKAATWNQMVQAGQWYARQRRLGEPGAIGQVGVHPHLVKVQNITGGNVVAGEVLTIGDFLLAEVTRNEPWFEADTFATGDLALCVLREDLRDDEIGVAQVGGVCRAIIDINSTSDEYAAPVNGDLRLESVDYSPIRILHAPNSTGDQDCIVYLDQLRFCPHVRLALTAALATSDASKSATLLEQWGYGIPNTTSSGAVTAYNMVRAGGSSYVFEGASGAIALATHEYGTRYRITQMECP